MYRPDPHAQDRALAPLRAKEQAGPLGSISSKSAADVERDKADAQRKLERDDHAGLRFLREKDRSVDSVSVTVSNHEAGIVNEPSLIDDPDAHVERMARAMQPEPPMDPFAASFGSKSEADQEFEAEGERIKERRADPAGLRHLRERDRADDLATAAPLPYRPTVHATIEPKRKKGA